MGAQARDDDGLDVVFARYERALQQGDRQEVTSARLTLCRLLEATGWEVPADVRDQMARDARTLQTLAEDAGPVTIDLLRAPSHRSPWATAG